MANEWWMNNRNNMRGYGNTGVTSVFNPNSMAAMVGRSNWLPQNITEETETIYPADNDLDANWQHQLRMQGIDRGNIDNKWYNRITTPVMGIMRAIGDKFQRPEAKQAEYDALRNVTDQYGTYRTGTLPTGQEAMIVDGKISVRAPDGTILLRDKNFDSMFGSGSVAEMIQKKEDWAKGRFDKYGDTWTDDEHKGISKAFYDHYKNTGALAKWRGDTGQKTYIDNIQTIAPETTKTFTIPSTAREMEISRRGGFNPSARSFSSHSPGGITQAQSRAARGDPTGTGGGWRLAQGGRVGLRMGGDPTEWMETQETISPFQIQQEEGVPIGLQASDDVNTRILENLFEKYLELGFSPEEAEIKAMEEFQLMSQGQDFDMGTQNEQGIASLV